MQNFFSFLIRYMCSPVNRSNKGKMEEEEENEGLAMLIPDIQDTARIVRIATDRLKQHEGIYIFIQYIQE